MFNAISQWDTSISVGERSDDAYKKFSFRQDFLGYFDNGLYPDPVSGEIVSPEAAFQSYIAQEEHYLDPWDINNPIPGFKVLKLNFSTAVMPETGNFFMINRWLEKIQFMRIKVFGGNIQATESIIDGYLVYGDNCFVRKQVMGVRDPENYDRIQNELTAYSTRHWRYDTVNQRWKTEDRYGSQAYQASISVQVSNDTDVPSQVYEINSFQEYSVASTNWTLYLVVESQSGLPKLDISQVEDLEIHFYSFYYSR